MNCPLLLLLIASLAVTGAAEPQKPFSLVGMWRAVSGAVSDGTPAPRDGEAEMEFLADGTLFITIQHSRDGADLVRMRFRYRYEPPNVVTYTPDGKILMRKLFRVIADKLYLDDLDFQSKSELRHIVKSEFSNKPKDVKGLTELPK